MRPAVRLADICSGHTCFPPRPNNSASTNVFYNVRGAHRLSDSWASHCCGPTCHIGVSSSGSNNVFINGRSAVRVGDSVSCGSTSAQGSLNIFINS